MEDMASQGLTRRDFAKGAAAGALTAGLVAGAAAQEAAKQAAEAAPAGQKIPLRDLGKTGYRVTEISLGAMEVEDQAVVEKALDAGCNYVDTAASYQGGQNEKMVGNVMAKRRKEVFLATKFGTSSKDKMLASIDRSLQRLQTDVIDLIQVHGVARAEQVKNPLFKEVFDEAQKAGKVRFFGFTAHSGQAEVLNACVDVGYVSAVLVGFGATDPPEVAAAVKRAREAGIAIVVMKSLKGASKFKGATGAMTPQQMAVRWVLDHPAVDTVNVGMTSFGQLDEDLKASGMKLSAVDRLNMRRFAADFAARNCTLCGKCGQCPQGVDTTELLRVHMYAFQYDNLLKARREFRAMDGARMLASCNDCGQCEKRCPSRLPVRSFIREVAHVTA